ncbi:N-glycosylase/DNA lyase [Petrotoga sibirica]|uniref:8-oxoguanine DNA glycosylase/AP lyase n=2 Tax=Petrotoga sibirica TaxID=156202 RepID=A0A4R8EE93_9BACT|nr:N-glycosylase/DNA lyase [Petrotoga sibirica]POZ89306.1 DNA lyase [Petrotoga sibirica DSM 13575]TDX10090.1 N-glycosylase/DNA lyase [Petrotoga sibirica]
MIHSNITNSLDILVNKIEDVKLTIKDEVERRFEEFKDIGKNGDELDLFSELSFCVLTANWRAKGGIKAQKLITKEGFAYYNEEQLISKLKEVGHRFPNARSRYIVENRWIIGSLKDLLQKDILESRRFLAENVKGISWKEASHFLRNVGKEDVAILDKHILRVMNDYNLVKEVPKPSWTEKKYTKFEKELRAFSKIVGEPLGKLDLYLWYMETGQIDK